MLKLLSEAEKETIDLHFKGSHRWKKLYTIPIDLPIQITCEEKSTTFLYSVVVDIISNQKDKLKGENKMIMTGKDTFDISAHFDRWNSYCKVRILDGKLMGVNVFLNYQKEHDVCYDIHFKAVRTIPAWVISKTVYDSGYLTKLKELHGLLQREENRDVDKDQLLKSIRFPPIEERTDRLVQNLKMSEKTHPITIDNNGTFSLTFEGVDISKVKAERDGESYLCVEVRLTVDKWCKVCSAFAMEFLTNGGLQVYHNTCPDDHYNDHYEPRYIDGNSWQYEFFDMFDDEFYGTVVEYTLDMRMGWVYTISKAKKLVVNSRKAVKKLDEILDELRCKPGGPGYVAAKENFHHLVQELSVS
jgi:hypothetical protein